VNEEIKMGSTISSPAVSGGQPIYERQTFPRSEKKLVPKANTIDNRNNNQSQPPTTDNGNNNQENSRMLFLMYLINRTWNVVAKR
jgi:hypothetical protein